jgi:hypothetical protein
MDSYLDKVLEYIEYDFQDKFQNLNKTVKKYTYFLPTHKLPYSITKEKKHLYANDYEHIYPMKELLESIRFKYPKYFVSFNEDKSEIVIDFSFQ